MRTNPVLDRLPAYPTAALEKRRREVEASGRRLFDFGVGDPVDDVPAFIRDALVGGVPATSGYPGAESVRAAQQAAAEYVKRRFGVRVDPETEVIATNGAKDAVYQLPLLVTEPGAADNGIAYPDPGYPGYARGALIAGATPVPVVLSGDFKMRVWELPTSVLRSLRLVWINHPHNPTGATLTRDELQRTADVCREHDVLVACDECYADVWDKERPRSMLETGLDGVVVLHSLSKRSGMTGYRAGFVAGDARWIARFAELRTNLGQPPQDFVNAAAAAAWADDAHAEERRLRFARRRRRLMAFLRGQGLDVLDTPATFYVWVRAPGGDGVAFAAQLLEKGVVVSPGEWYGEGGRGWVRFAVCGDDAEIEAAMAAWEGA